MSAGTSASINGMLLLCNNAFNVLFQSKRVNVNEIVPSKPTSWSGLTSAYVEIVWKRFCLLWFRNTSQTRTITSPLRFLDGTAESEIRCFMAKRLRVYILRKIWCQPYFRRFYVLLGSSLTTHEKICYNGPYRRNRNTSTFLNLLLFQQLLAMRNLPFYLEKVWMLKN